MKKETYFQTLYKRLRKLPENDRQTTVAFYREIVEDRMENGLSEEAAVASLGDVHQLAQKILLENPQRRSSTKPLWIALGVTMAVLVGMGALVTCGVLTYRELRTSSVAEPIGPMEDSIPSSQLPEGAVQGEKASTPPSEEGQTEKHMEEYRTSVEEVDVVEVDAENKQILFESSEEEELVILYETDDTQFYSIKNEGRSVTLKNEDHRRSDQTEGSYRIHVQIPSAYMGSLKVETGNGKIVAKNLQQLADVSCVTDNAAIVLEEFAAQKLSVESKNGAISLHDVQADQSLALHATNGFIGLTGCTSPETGIATRNGAIHLTQVQAAQAIRVESSNGAISLDSLESPDIQLQNQIGAITGSIQGKKADYRIVTEQKLGENNLTDQSGGTKQLQVKTNLGRIHVTFNE